MCQAMFYMTSFNPGWVWPAPPHTLLTDGTYNVHFVQVRTVPAEHNTTVMSTVHFAYLADAIHLVVVRIHDQLGTHMFGVRVIRMYFTGFRPSTSHFLERLILSPLPRLRVLHLPLGYAQA